MSGEGVGRIAVIGKPKAHRGADHPNKPTPGLLGAPGAETRRTAKVGTPSGDAITCLGFLALLARLWQHSWLAVVRQHWRHMRTTFVLVLLSSVFASAQAQPPAPQHFKLPATPKTVAWGYYDAAAPPVLRIHSGDTVEFDTLITNSPTGLEKAGVAPDQVQQSLRDVYKEVTNKGPGGHILNGPVYVEEADPATPWKSAYRKSTWPFRTLTTPLAPRAAFCRKTFLIAR